MKNISNLLIVVVSALLVISCTPKQSERTVSQEKLTNVAGLEDCTAIKYNYSGWHSDALLIRCPNSSVTTTTYHASGKSVTTKVNTVIDQEPLTNVRGLQDCTETRYDYSWIHSDTIVIRCSSKQLPN